MYIIDILYGVYFLHIKYIMYIFLHIRYIIVLYILHIISIFFQLDGFKIIHLLLHFKVVKSCCGNLHVESLGVKFRENFHADLGFIRENGGKIFTWEMVV